MNQTEKSITDNDGIIWPQHYAPKSDEPPIIIRNEIFINAPKERIWERLITAKEWPNWYKNSHLVRYLNEEDDDTLTHGRQFSWITFATPIVSEVKEFVPFSRIAWDGQNNSVLPDINILEKSQEFVDNNFAGGISEKLDVYHAWLIKPNDENTRCHIITKESQYGVPTIFIQQQKAIMHTGHKLWLESLKRMSED